MPAAPMRQGRRSRTLRNQPTYHAVLCRNRKEHQLAAAKGHAEPGELGVSHAAPVGTSSPTLAEPKPRTLAARLVGRRVLRAGEPRAGSLSVGKQAHRQFKNVPNGKQREDTIMDQPVALSSQFAQVAPSGLHGLAERLSVRLL